jgi:hypothetical protein
VLFPLMAAVPSASLGEIVGSLAPCRDLDAAGGRSGQPPAAHERRPRGIFAQDACRASS